LIVKSCVSPDGRYIVAGSEDGKPRLWETSPEDVVDTGLYEYKLMDMVSDCAWNPKYNMMAVAGFGQEFPVLVYVYERSERELTEALINGAKFFGTPAGEAERLKRKMESKYENETLF
jgi:WD40 repeat protein